MKKTKKAISVLLILVISISICACDFNLFGVNTDNYAVALSSGKKEVEYSVYKSDEYTAFNSKLTDFSSKISALLYKEFGDGNENISFSPVSVYMALALAVECSDGQTREEILEALGMSYEDVSEFTSILYSKRNTSYYYNGALTGQKKVCAFEEMHNSVWIDGSISVNKENAAKLAKNFNADIFSVNFKNGEADRVIKQYINDKTHGLVDGDVKMDEETVFTLLSTLYLKEIWLELGKELDKTDEKYDFKNTNGNTTSTKLLKTNYISGRAYGGENYKSIFARTNHGYKLHFILPDEGVSAGDVFTEKNISEILSITDYESVDDEARQIHYTRVFFPEFEASFDGNIDSVLQDGLGIMEMYSPTNADFSALVNSTGQNLFCQKTVHKTNIKVDARGIEGAAITAMLGAGAAGPPPYEKVYHDFIVDRAFGFILTDPHGTVLFSGVVNTK